MDLYGKQGYFRFTLAAWNRMLRLAEHYGWRPAGTRPGRSELRRLRYRANKAGKTPAQIRRLVRRHVRSFHGDYWMNEQQAVTAADAKHLAAALARALPHTPRRDLLEQRSAELTRWEKRTGRTASARQE